MSEQEQTQVPANGRRSRKTKRNIHTTALKYPANDDKDALKAYWETQGQHWRTEPEIDVERQKYLDERRNIKPDIENGTYPFKGIKLSRADVEWLLATHENGRGPVDWSDENQQSRKGIDLRGADLRQVDLRDLPLAHTLGGLVLYEYRFPETAEEIHKITSILVSGTDLSGEQFEEESFKAAMASVLMDEADLIGTHLEGAILTGAQMKKTKLILAHLERADCTSAWLEEADLGSAHLEKAKLLGIQLESAKVSWAWLEEADLTAAILERADLHRARLRNATLDSTRLGRANLTEAHLEGADLRVVDLTDERGIGPQLADIQWGTTNLTIIRWSQMNMLGDEYQARQKKQNGKTKDKFTRIHEYEDAARANRQLAVALQVQGLNEDAARFAYHAQLMQRKVYWYYPKIWQYLGSLFLDLLSGYGFRVERCFIAYVIVIGIFATIYHLLGTNLPWNEAIVISMTAFHGRGFFPEQFKPGDPQAMVAAIEAFIGLLIEVTFIATLTQRLFGR